MRFLRGDFKRAHPARGRFRDYVKTSLQNLLRDHFARDKSLPQSLRLESGLLGNSHNETSQDIHFAERWREELLECTWRELQHVEVQSGTPYYTVLRRRVEQPKETARSLANGLSLERRRAFSEPGVRQLLHRAREKFAELLLSEVRRSLETDAVAELADELAELKLLPYCQPALDRRVEQGQ